MKAKTIAQNQIAMMLKQRKAMSKSGKVVLRKPPRSLFPRQAMTDYYKDLKLLILYLKQLTKFIILPELEQIKKTANINKPPVLQDSANSQRSDSTTSELEKMMSDFKRKFREKYGTDQVKEIVNKRAIQISNFNSKQIDKQVKAVIGVDVFRNEPWLKDQMELFTKSNVDLIESIETKYLGEVEGIVSRGAVYGRNTGDIAEDIQKRLGVAASKAALIARDQTSKFNGALTMLRQTEVGVESYVWQTSGDERVRETHEANDGKTFRWDNPPAETGHPSDDINCRCNAIPVFKPADFE